MQKYKTIKSKTEYYVEFSDEEKAEFGWEDNQKFSWKILDDGSVKLEPWKKVDIGEMSEFPREVLEMIIQESLEKDITVNQVIVDLLKQSLDSLDLKNNSKYISAKELFDSSIDPNFTNNDIGLPGGAHDDILDRAEES